MKKLWKFTNENAPFTGRFESKNPPYSSLYYPLCNQAGLMSAVTPELKGDIKTGQHSFLTIPCVTEDLHQTKASRNFWIRSKNGSVWSASGVSAEETAAKAQGTQTKTRAAAQPGSFSVSRENKGLGLQSDCTVFVPAGSHKIEITIVTISNASKKTITFTPFWALPLFGRDADRIRDHRQVTTMLNRVIETPFGPVLQPSMSFDERGHKENKTKYFSFGFEGDGALPSGWWGCLHDFIGSAGALDAPQAVYENWDPPAEGSRYKDGTEAISALKFHSLALKPGCRASYVFITGICEQMDELEAIVNAYASFEKASAAHSAAVSFWRQEIEKTTFHTSSPEFNNWMSWIIFQPMLRKIFGCSFLPDFGYGRGGRGWRDLWQDCLALILVDPGQTRDLLKNNFAGVRIDGSNATIIGREPGSFLADRNNIPRVWMDHGVWPFITTRLYIEQSADIDFLLEKAPYFKDIQAFRSSQKDELWNESQGCAQKTSKGKVYEGTILEHLLLQNVTQFFNVGEHNVMKLEGADWNDGLDMAKNRGESVAFTSMYGHNLREIARLLRTLKAKGHDTITLFKEISILLDSMPGQKGSGGYSNPKYKNALLSRYFEAVRHSVSGETVKVKTDDLIKDLSKKAEHILETVASQEWLKDGYFNGYYDNDGERVEGIKNGRRQMTLTGQVFPIMSGAASEKQVKTAYESANRFLRHKELGGFHLNTDFGSIRLNLGRAFGFSYGDKENGAFFSHMIVMFMYGLYSRGFAEQGFDVFNSVFEMCMNSAQSRIFPGLPEYFNIRGEGRYHYLTGSASWMFLTILTQMFGVRGYLGDLVLDPKLCSVQFPGAFPKQRRVQVKTMFRGKKLDITYINAKGLSYPDYKIEAITLNDKKCQFQKKDRMAVIAFSELNAAHNVITVTLG